MSPLRINTSSEGLNEAVQLAEYKIRHLKNFLFNQITRWLSDRFSSVNIDKNDLKSARRLVEECSNSYPKDS